MNRIVYYTIPNLPGHELRYVVKGAKSDESAIKVVKKHKPHATIVRVAS